MHQLHPLTAVFLLGILFGTGNSADNPDSLTLPGAILQVETASSGRFLVMRFTGSDGLGVYDTESGTLSRTLPSPDDGIFAAGGERVVVSSAGSELIQIFDVGTGRKVLSTRNPFPGPIAALRMGMCDDQRAAALIRLERGQQVRIGMLDLTTGKPIGPLTDFWAGFQEKDFGYLTTSRITATLFDLRNRASVWRFEPAGFVNHPIEALDSSGHPHAADSDSGLLYVGGAILGRNLQVRNQTRDQWYLPDAGCAMALRVSQKGEPTITSATGTKDLMTLETLDGWSEVLMKKFKSSDRERTGFLPFSSRLRLDLLKDRLIWIPFDNQQIVRRTLQMRERLTALGKPYLIPLSATLPRAEAGTTWSHQLTFLSSSKTCAVSGEIVPDGMQVSTDGRLSWAIPANASGTHDLMLSFLGDGGKVAMLELALTIELPRGSPEIAPQEPAGEFTLRSSWAYAPSHDGTQAYLARDTRIDVLDPDLQRSVRTIQTERTYRFLADRPEYLIGLDERGVDLVDQRTGKVIKRIPVPGKTWNLVASPKNRQCFVVGDNGVDPNRSPEAMQRQRIWRIDETNGTAALLEDAFAHHIAIHPSGSVLYGLLHGLQPRLIPGIDRFGNEYLVADHTGFTWLLAYQIEDKRLMLRSVQRKPGSWMDGAISISPDGKEVAYGSSSGFQVGIGRSVLPVFDAGNLERLERGYHVDSNYLRFLSYHPVLDLVVTRTKLLDRRSGEDLPTVLRTTDSRDRQLAPYAFRSWFSPGGRHVAFLCGDMNNYETPRMIRILPLNLRPEDESRLRDHTRGAIVPPAFTTGDQLAANTAKAGKPLTKDDKPVTVAMLPGSTRKPSAVKISPADLAAKFQNAVVTIHHRDGSGTGMFIGEGLILTCAHVIPAVGSPTSIDYCVEKDGKVTTLVADQVILRRLDARNDLALIQITPSGPVTQVTLSDVAPRTGEPVCVMGSPGLGGLSLDHTLTTGIISTPRRELDGLAFIQTSAAVNPGNSGGPLFDDRGSVIGVIVLKANIEAVGFAVPMSTIRQFLAAAQR